jgi:transcriptional regulator with XRE-family HTH domain
MTYDEAIKLLIQGRTNAGISQRKMAARLDLTPQALSMILEIDVHPKVGMAQLRVPAEKVGLVNAAIALPPEMASEMEEIIRALPGAPANFRAGVLSALRSLLPAASAA